MVCRGGGVWVSRDGLSPYEQLTDRSVYPPVEGRFEDPVVWRDHLQYHLIVNDWLGRIAYYQRSKDGLHWVTEQGEAYVPGVSVHPDGQVEHWFKYERPKVFQDSLGRAVQANFAVIDTIKWEDQPNDNHSSKNICIPLNKGLLVEVMNRDTITADTKTIEVRIRAEKDFDPQKDVDVKSLRFGAFSEVNFGRGCKAIRSHKVGKDLIVEFDGAGNGIQPDEFAPKLLGRDKKGRLLYGYASLPYVNYRPAMLSAAYPMYDKEGKALTLEVKNYGLSSSAPSQIVVEAGGRKLAEGQIAPLAPYATAALRLDSDFVPTEKELSGLTVIFYIDGKEVGSSYKALREKKQMIKLEFLESEVYQVISRYMEIDGQPYVMELINHLEDDTLIDISCREKLINKLTGYNEKLYKDVLTGVYNRLYFEEEIKMWTGNAGIVVIDVDDFKLCNDTYGHLTGDMALAAVAGVIWRCIRREDTLVRYGGDEFVLVLPEIKEDGLVEKLQEIQEKVQNAVIPGYSNIQLSVSMGAVISQNESVEHAMLRARKLMYQAKNKKNMAITENNMIDHEGKIHAQKQPEKMIPEILVVDDEEVNRTLLDMIFST